MSDVTRLLSAIDQGDPLAAKQLLPLVYDELRKLAAAKLAHEKPGQTLQATALVHEAYLRLLGGGDGKQERGPSDEGESGRGGEGENSHLPLSHSTPLPPSPPSFNSRGHFFAAAAEAMRRLLVESARRKASLKRGEGLVRQPLDELEIAAPESRYDVLALDDALRQLAAADAQAAELVKLRFFAGLTAEQAAAALGVSARTADRIWGYARAYLFTCLATS
jgi:RNA polymerase sigma factor (sigma-70 family)